MLLESTALARHTPRLASAMGELKGDDLDTFMMEMEQGAMLLVRQVRQERGSRCGATPRRGR